MEEQVFFENRHVKVTNTRFVAGGQTFAMSNVTSVKSTKKVPFRLGWILVLFTGLTLMTALFPAGLAVTVLAAGCLYRQKTQYHVMLSTASGEISALKSPVRKEIEQVVEALNNAIIHRG